MKDPKEGLIPEEYLKDISLQILDAMDDMVRVVDKNGTILYSNRAMDSLFGFSIVGKNEKDFSEYIDFKVSEITFFTNTTYIDEIKINKRTYSIRSSPVKDKNKKAILAVEVFRDITAQTKMMNYLQKTNNKMIKDINFAKLIQKSILPRLRDFNGYIFDYKYLPSDQLSGDIFDFIVVDDSRLAIYVADVVGHGVSASIMTMFIRQTVRSIIQEAKGIYPNEVFLELKRRFVDLSLDVDQYFSIFYGILDIKKNIFTYGNGGHNCPPIKFSKDSYEILFSKGRFISNILSDYEYQEKEIYLDKDDEIILYTDGLIETKNIDGQDFAIENIIRVRKTSKDNLLDDILKKLKEFKFGEQRDDIALIYFKRRK